MLLGVPSALAIDDFTDVPTAHPFHSDIAAMKDTWTMSGKTCVPPGTPPTYCPSENITREAMAAFMRRGIGRIDMDNTVNATDIPLGVFMAVQLHNEAMLVGGIAGNQYVKAVGWLNIETADNLSGECEVAARLVQDKGQPDQVLSSETLAELGVGDADQTVHVSWVFAAPSGSHSYALDAHNVNLTCADAGANNVIEVSEAVVIVETFPLNQDGFSDTFPPGPELGESEGTAVGSSSPNEP